VRPAARWHRVHVDEGRVGHRLRDRHVTITRQANSKLQLAQVKTQTGERQIEAPEWLLLTLREQKLRSPFSSDEDLVFPRGERSGSSEGASRCVVRQTKMAALMAAGGGDVRQETAIDDPAEVVSLSSRRIGSPETATAQG
jgi:hypothetical protein